MSEHRPQAAPRTERNGMKKTTITYNQQPTTAWATRVDGLSALKSPTSARWLLWHDASSTYIGIYNKRAHVEIAALCLKPYADWTTLMPDVSMLPVTEAARLSALVHAQIELHEAESSLRAAQRRAERKAA